MGLQVSVYRSSMGDCTNCGISAQVHELILVNVDGPTNVKYDNPDNDESYNARWAAQWVKYRAAWLDKRNGVLRIIPAYSENGVWSPGRKWYMMGGNYAATSDSRFSEACRAMLGQGFYGAVAIHDRCEG